jgi:hypothetical protein
MNDAFAGAVTVSIPIFALAAGAEARSIRDRLRRPDEKWEKEFARHREEHDLDLDGDATEVFAYFRGVSGLSKLYLAERILAIAAAVAWLVVFVLLTIAGRCDGRPDSRADALPGGAADASAGRYSERPEGHPRTETQRDERAGFRQAGPARA